MTDDKKHSSSDVLHDGYVKLETLSRNFNKTVKELSNDLEEVEACMKDRYKIIMKQLNLFKGTTLGSYLFPTNNWQRWVFRNRKPLKIAFSILASEVFKNILDRCYDCFYTNDCSYRVLIVIATGRSHVFYDLTIANHILNYGKSGGELEATVYDGNGKFLRKECLTYEPAVCFKPRIEDIIAKVIPVSCFDSKERVCIINMNEFAKMPDVRIIPIIDNGKNPSYKMVFEDSTYRVTIMPDGKRVPELYSTCE